MHRPMVAQESAESAEIYFRGDGIGHRPISTNLDFDTYEYIARTHERPKSREHRGFVTSYNTNTFKGRFYSVTAERPIPFELYDIGRSPKNVALIVNSLRENALKRGGSTRMIGLKTREFVSSTDSLKKFGVMDVFKDD